MRVLVVEDEAPIANFIRTILEEDGNQVTHTGTVEEVIEKNYALSHDLIVLDLMLPGRDGQELVKEVRQKKLKTPILVLSALGQINTKVQLINMGADDYLTKPFDRNELLARVKALYRRYSELPLEDEETYNEITFFWKQNRMIREGKEILLTNKESKLLQLLLRNKGQVVKTEAILEKVWQSKKGYHSNIVASTVRRLRRKLDNGFETPLIRNVHGVGYVLNI